jgi:acyl-CoA synthetase (NDP forming)
MRQTRFAAQKADAMVHLAIDTKKIADIVAAAKADGRNFLLAAEGQDLLKAAGINMPAHAIAKSADEAVKFADEISYPVVMKIVSRDILHKSDAGGVIVGVKDAAAVRAGFDKIMANIKAYKADAQIDGIEICEMVKPGVETIIGARQDGSFGPTAMFGLGGIYVEVMKDVTFRSLPISKSEVSDMVKSIRTYKLLTGVRGEKAKDIASIEDAIIRVGEVLQCCDQITDIEVNPLVVYEEGKGTKAVDIRVMLKK